MPSVADELAELRSRSLTKNHAAKLQDANGLSTPEMEAQAIQTVKSNTRSSIYKKEAVETLKAGPNANAVNPFEMQQIARKKEEQQKQKEAMQNLQQFNNAKVALTLSDDTKKPKDSEEPKEKSIAPVVEPAAAATSATAAATEASMEEIEEVPELEVGPTETETETVPPKAEPTTDPGPLPQPAVRQLNRVEKKARKAMERLGMKPVPGVARVTLKRKGGVFTIHRPDVFEKSGSFVVFGEAVAGAGLAPQFQQQEAAKQFAMAEEKKEEVLEAVPDLQLQDGTPDETGLQAKDIELVMSQANCSRPKAVAALKTSGGDLVDAIMCLTS